jgi:hypothetical protein
VLEREYRPRGDVEVDEIFRLLEDIGRPVTASEDLLSYAEDCYKKILVAVGDDNSTTARTVDSIHEVLSTAEKALASFYEHYTVLPEWYDEDQIFRGQQVQQAYFGAIGLALYYRSLAPGFSIPKIAAVLVTTGFLTPP